MAAAPWTEAHSRLTKGFETGAIDVLLEARNISSAVKLLRLGWSTADHIMKKTVVMSRKFPCLGLMRRASARGKSSNCGWETLSQTKLSVRGLQRLRWIEASQ
jgi:hypothetical protein